MTYQPQLPEAFVACDDDGTPDTKVVICTHCYRHTLTDAHRADLTPTDEFLLRCDDAWCFVCRASVDVAEVTHEGIDPDYRCNCKAP